MSVITGPVVRPTNRHYASGIHDDATAQAAGFRGGTIAGSAHLDTLVPLAVQRFGDQWFVGGGVSMMFRNPTVDGEPTYAELDSEAPLGQCEARIVRSPDGLLVGSGTVGGPAAVGLAQLHAEPLRHKPDDVRILSALHQGDEIGPDHDQIDGTDLRLRCEAGLITEPLDWYVHTSPWGGTIAPPSGVIDAVNRAVSRALLPILPAAVGMWGALEVQFVEGPVFTDRRYRIVGSVAAISTSPKTEVIWQDMQLIDTDTDKLNATVRIQSRFVKSSSPLWQLSE
jgi:hypothetical protein